MFFGLSHVDVPVADFDRSLRIYRDTCGFAVVTKGDGWIDLDAATTTVRLIKSTNVERPATLRIECQDVEACVKQLVAAGATVLYEPARTDLLTVEGTTSDADGNTLTLWRKLSEDEYGFDPDLPTELVWEKEAEVVLKSLLRSVPALFRGLARRKIVKEAEQRAARTKRIDRDLAIRSFISAQAPPNRKRLYAPLRKLGIDPDAYRDEFEA